MCQDPGAHGPALDLAPILTLHSVYCSALRLHTSTRIYPGCSLSDLDLMWPPAGTSATQLTTCKWAHLNYTLHSAWISAWPHHTHERVSLRTASSKPAFQDCLWADLQVYKYPRIQEYMYASQHSKATIFELQITIPMKFDQNAAFSLYMHVQQ